MNMDDTNSFNLRSFGVVVFPEYILVSFGGTKPGFLEPGFRYERFHSSVE